MIDLRLLPDPAIVERLDYETILAELLADFRRRYPDYSAMLESDPAMKLLEVAAYREMLLRHRINAAARSQLLAFAEGSDLDHLAAFYGVTRLVGEADAALRARVQARITGWANAGGAAHYRYWALSASPDVEDAAVVSPAPGVVRIAVLVRLGADATATLAAVQALVSREDVRVLTDTVEVVDARRRPVSIQARIWRLPEAPASIAATLADLARAEARASAKLGWDVTRSWIISRLQRPGVHRVELIAPQEDVRCAPDEAAAIEAVEVIDAGVDA